MELAELESEFYQLVEKNFSFLLDEGRFKGPYSLESGTIGSRLYYLGSNIAVELVMDVKDDFVGCEVSKVIDRHPAPFRWPPYQDRKLLSQLIEPDEHEPSSLLKKLARKGVVANMSYFVEENARLLKEYGQEIIADSPDVFPAS